jgi:hypothetical protein
LYAYEVHIHEVHTHEAQAWSVRCRPSEMQAHMM